MGVCHRTPWHGKRKYQWLSSPEHVCRTSTNNHQYVIPTSEQVQGIVAQSKHWHLIDYVIVWQRDSRYVTKTCTMGATTGWSDHRMVRNRTRLTFKGMCGTKPMKKLDVARLKSVDIQRQLGNKMDDVIKEQTETTLNVDETWTKLRDTVYLGALDVIGTTKRSKHRDRFDENDAEAATILRKMHESHLQWINDRESAAKADTYR